MPEADEDTTFTGSFARETFTVALGDFVRELIPTLLTREDVRARYGESKQQRVLAQFEFGDWGRLDVAAVGPRDRFVLHATHKEFELVAQVAFVDGSVFDALRVAQFSGNLMTALVWSRTLGASAQPGSANDASHTKPLWATYLN